MNGMTLWAPWLTRTAARLSRHLLAGAVVLTLALLQGCIVYRIDVQQGNEITADMLAELRLGMSRSEVVGALGYPLVNDPFHVDRWDYYFYLKKGDSGKIQQHSATLRFTGEALSAIDSALLDSPE